MVGWLEIWLLLLHIYIYYYFINLVGWFRYGLIVFKNRYKDSSHLIRILWFMSTGFFVASGKGLLMMLVYIIDGTPPWYYWFYIYVRSRLNSHYFHTIGDGHPTSRDLYTHWMTILNIWFVYILWNTSRAALLEPAFPSRNQLESHARYV